MTAKPGMVSMIAGVLVAGAAFGMLQAWTPPMVILKQLGASDARQPAPTEPRYKLAVRPEPATATPLATEADVVAARVRPAPEGAGGVTLELAAPARARLADFARQHAADPLAVAVDGTVIYTKPAAELVKASLIDLPAGAPLDPSPTQIAARFGGAVVPPAGYLVQAARLVPALVVGFLALALVRILTRR